MNVYNKVVLYFLIDLLGIFLEIIGIVSSHDLINLS